MARSGLIKLICKVLGKAMPYVTNKDSRAFETFKNLPENLTISLGVFGEPTYLTLQKTKEQILVIKNENKNECDLEIEFKNRKSAKLVLLGSISVAESFARHDILLKGNINTAVALVRIIDICEYYLFPRFITYKFLPKMKKQFCSLSLYFFILFGIASQIKITNLADKTKMRSKEKKKNGKDIKNNSIDLEKPMREEESEIKNLENETEIQNMEEEENE